MQKHALFYQYESLLWLGDNSSQIPKSDYSSQAAIRPICEKRQFAPNCLIDQLINNLLKIEIKELNE